MGRTPDLIDNTTELLLALIRHGFRFIHPRDASGDLLAIQGVRVHHNVIDVVVLRSEDEAKAVRMPGDQLDILRPTTTLWRAAGQAHDVLAQLLDLPDDTPALTTAADGCWVPTQAGRASWLPSTA